MARRLQLLARPLRAASALALVVALASCKVTHVTDIALTAPTNDETYAALGYLWSGVPSAIQGARDTPASPFSLNLAYAPSCPRGGQGTYHGTLAGTKSGGTGSATLSLTAVLTGCQFDDGTTITIVTAPSVTATGTVAVTNDQWGTFQVHMVATSVTVNGKDCPGGVDVVLTGTAPSAQTISTGTACGRTGAVPLP